MSVIEGLHIGQVGDGDGAEGRAAGGQHIDDVKDAEGLHGADDQRHQNRGAQQGQADQPEALPGIGAVDGRGLFHFLGKRGQGSLKDQRHKRHGVPDICQDHQIHGARRVDEPGDILLDESKLVEQAIQGAIVRVVDPTPHHAGDNGRNGPGDDQAGAQELPARRVRSDQLGDGDPEDQFQADRKQGEVQGAADGRPEDGALEQVDVVPQPGVLVAYCTLMRLCQIHAGKTNASGPRIVCNDPSRWLFLF